MLKPLLKSLLKSPLKSLLKSVLRWAVLGLTLGFLLHTVVRHWSEVSTVQLDGSAYGLLAIALGVTLLAHGWSGWVWGLILQHLGYPVSPLWAVRVHLTTNIAKYLPGNIWHFYGRVRAIAQHTILQSNIPQNNIPQNTEAIQAQRIGTQVIGAGIPRTQVIELAVLSVVLEPLLMAAAALLIAGVGSPQAHELGQMLGLLGILVGVHPRFLNPVLRWVGKGKAKMVATPEILATKTLATIQDNEIPPFHLQLTHYPLKPLLGELGFLACRGLGFVLAVLAFSPVPLSQLPLLMSAFSFAWVLGLVVPGAPGGIGVFEATIIALLDRAIAPGVLLNIVGCFRLVSILAEVMGAGLGWLGERWTSRSNISPEKTQ